MVKNPVKVYARIKSNQLLNEVYSVRKKENYDVLTLNKYGKQRNKYKFHEIFDQKSSQEHVFENTTKSIVNSVLQGFNGTVFAYGQTGSGKTYSMTGCTDEYENRGIIPRCIQEIFQFTNKTPNQYTVFISYMEIYNEIGYDLLNPKHQATKLEELPRVTLMDDGKGEAHLRNLFTLPVMTEQEAMRLLFLGDTNRTIAETPMNDYSSRSHCIFTIYISRTENERKIRKSKLNLVDLAGSERIYKSNISGTTLTEAKNINLSLHYLEQVILALSQSKRSHIPFRNSMMTYMLRDSLAGNSITVMLATLAIKANNVDETAVTCNFSQRVAMVNTDATINEIFDPQEEIEHLRNEVTHLRKKLTTSPSDILIGGKKELSETEIELCQELAAQFLKTGQWNNNVTLNLEQCNQCFQTFRNIIIKLEENLQMKQDSVSTVQQIDECSCAKSDIVDKFKEIIQQKDEEIDILTQLLEAYDLSKNHNVTNHDKSSELEECVPEEIELTANDEDLFEEFLSKNENSAQLTNFKAQIDGKHRSAEQISAFVESCQQNILRLRRKLEMGYGITDPSYVTQIQNSLKLQQDVYAKSIENLKTIKEETDFLEHGMKQERIRLERTFCSQKVDKCKKPANSEHGLFARINESLKNIERKFSAKVKQQPKPRVSPKKAANEYRLKNKDRTGKLVTKKRSNTSSVDKLKSTKPNKDKTAIINPYHYQNKPTNDQFVDPIKQTSTKKSIKHSISAAKLILQPSNKRNDKKHHNELFSGYVVNPTNITTLNNPHKSNTKEDRYNNNADITPNKTADSNVTSTRTSTNSSYQTVPIKCTDTKVLSESKSDDLSDNDSDLIFERKIQSYLQKIPANPQKDIQSRYQADGDDNEDYTKPPDDRRCLDRGYKNLGEFNTANMNRLRQLNKINDDAENKQNKNALGQEDVKLLPQRNRLVNMRDDYFRHVSPSSDQLDVCNYDEANSVYNDVLQEEHIPVKDFTVSQRSSSSDELLKRQNKPADNRSMFHKADTEEFIEFMQTIPLTGDDDVDEEIIKFYRTKFAQQQ